MNAWASLVQGGVRMMKIAVAVEVIWECGGNLLRSIRAFA
jgi:hypothetical protein